MGRPLLAITSLFLLGIFAMPSTFGQSPDDLNLQIHGYATQGFIYSNTNNWNTTDSTSGSASWTEAVVNVATQPQPKLRIGIQARYFLLGDYGNKIVIDWALGEYKVNDRLGVRFGKVKSPTGLLNETQDVDPAHLWILLPQSTYLVSSVNSTLSHYGGLVFGTVPLGESMGKLEYRGYGGERLVPADDTELTPANAFGLLVPNGLRGRVLGATLRWRTPLRGLMVGANEGNERAAGTITYGPLPGMLTTKPSFYPFYYSTYERGKLMFAGEYSRKASLATIALAGIPAVPLRSDQRRFYGMASYKLTDRLTGGVYYSSAMDRQARFDSNRYQKDWDISGRYDFNPYLYFKLEQHFLDGTAIGNSTAFISTVGLSETSRLTLARLGVSF